MKWNRKMRFYSFSAGEQGLLCLPGAPGHCSGTASLLHSLSRTGLKLPGSLQSSLTTPSTCESKTLQNCTSASTAFPSPTGFHSTTLFSQRLHPLLQRWLRDSNELISRGNEFNYLSRCQNWDVWPEIFQAACQPKDGLGSWLKTEQQFLRIIRK